MPLRQGLVKASSDLSRLSHEPSARGRRFSGYDRGEVLKFLPMGACQPVALESLGETAKRGLCSAQGKVPLSIIVEATITLAIGGST